MRLVKASLIAFLMMLFTAIPVFAIDEPDTFTIDSVYVYQNLKQSGDQLYLIEYTIGWTTYPDDYPTETATQSIMISLFDGATELGRVNPYTFWHKGYDRGITGIYFPAATAPDWNGDYTVTMQGIDTLTWSPSLPTVSESSFDNWSTSTTLNATKIELTARMVQESLTLETAWVGQDLITFSNSTNVLTDTGATYWSGSIPNISQVVPSLFASVVINPIYPTVQPTNTPFADSQRHLVDGTPLDFTELAASFGIDNPFYIRTPLWYGLALMVVVGGLRMGGSYRLALPIFGLSSVIGGAIGMVPLTAPIVIGFIFLVAVAYLIFWKQGGG